MKPFYFDIETVPAQDPAIRADMRAAVQAPGNYSKPESIQKWLDENRNAVGDEQWLKTSFDGGVGQCVCIGYALGDEAPQTFSVGDLTRDTEASMLAGFFEVLGSVKPIERPRAAR